MSVLSLDEGMNMSSPAAMPRTAYCAWPQWIERTLRHSGGHGRGSRDEGQTGAVTNPARQSPLAGSAEAMAAPGCPS